MSQNIYNFLYPVAQASLNPVSMMSGSQQRVIIAQNSEQGSPLQQAPPAAAAALNNVPVEAFLPQATSTKKLSVNERKRKRKCHPNGHEEFPVIIMFTFYKMLLPFPHDNCCCQ